MNIQHIDVSAGEDRTQTLYARDSANLPLDLTGKTVAVYVGRSPWHPDSTQVLFTMTGTATDAAGGAFTIPILASDTKYRGGDYQYVARVTTGSSIATVCTGRFRVVPEMVTP